jgi:hypothetical protein
MKARNAVMLCLLGLAASIALGAAPAQAQATRTWVSGVGDDANPCSRTAPCKTFAGAISKTAAGGIINCIDPGGFGAVTITKSITIDCQNTQAGVLAAGTNAININGAGIIVILRGLSIEGVGSGLIGVNFINGSVLHIENCKIFGFRSGSALGIKFAPPAGVIAELYVSDTVIEDNGTAATNGGILIQPVGTGAANVIIDNVKVTNNTAGIRVDGTGNTGASNVTIRNSTIAGHTNNGVTAISPAGGGPLNVLITATTVSFNVGVGVNANGAAASGLGSAIVRIGGSTITQNLTGVSITGSGILQSFKNNQIAGNAADGTPINAFPGPGGQPLQ